MKSLNISGGTFIGGIMTSQDLANTSPAKFEITGGTFSDFSVLPYIKDNELVSIKLQKDIDITSVSYGAITRGVKVNLDLNGKTINCSDDYVVSVREGELTIDDSSKSQTGKIIEAATSIDHRFGAVRVMGNADGDNNQKTWNSVPRHSKLTLNKGSISGYWFGMGLMGNGAEAVINGGVVETHGGDGYAISGNGSPRCAGTKLTITGGKIRSEAGDNVSAASVYHPQRGQVDISGGIFTADTVLSIKDGTFNISGGIFNANGNWIDPASASSNGIEATGACVSVTSNTSYVGPNKENDKIDVNITGGTYTSANGNAIYEGIAVKNNTPAADKTYVNKLEITGGTFVGATGKEAVKISNFTSIPTKGITGGEYSSDPTRYVATSTARSTYQMQYANKTTYLVGPTSNPLLPALPTNYSWQKTSGNIYRATYNAPYIPPVTPVTPVTPTTPVVEEPVVPGGVASSTTNGTTTAKVVPTTNGTQATATVNTTMGNTLVQKAVTNNSAEVVINAVSPTTSTSTAPKSTAVELPKSVVTDVVNRTEADVVVEANAAAITIDQVALKEINGQTTGNKITIAIDEVEKPPTVIQNVVGSDAKILKLEVKNQDGTAIKNFNLGRVTVTTAIPSSLANKEVACLYITDAGKQTLMSGEVITVKGVRYYEFMTNHFSYYALVPKTVADKVGTANPPTTDNEPVVDDPVNPSVTTARVKALKLSLRSAKYSSGIKINWQKSSSTSVDGYQIFKSRKKNSGYSLCMVVQGSKTSYMNNGYLKSGRKYYFKVRAYKVVNGSRVYTKYSNVASRTF